MEQATETTQAATAPAAPATTQGSEAPVQATETKSPETTQPAVNTEEPKKQASSWMKWTLIILGILIVLGGVGYWIFR